MTGDYPRTEWDRAVDAVREAHLLLAKHSALEAAVHRDLVKAGKWSGDLGRDFSFCVDLRGVGDYGTEVRVDATQAADAIASARRILVAVRDLLPVNFPPVPNG